MTEQQQVGGPQSARQPLLPRWIAVTDERRRYWVYEGRFWRHCAIFAQGSPTRYVGLLYDRLTELGPFETLPEAQLEVEIAWAEGLGRACL